MRLWLPATLALLAPLALVPPTAGVAAEHTTDTPTEAVADTLIFVLAPEGNVARFRVREQLAGIAFPIDAVGQIENLSGSLAVTSDGAVIPEASRFIIRVADLATDRANRDNFLRRNTLETDTYPDIIFQPTSLEGIRFPLPDEANVSFQIVGNLTIRDRTVPATWEVGAAVQQGDVRGRAETRFTFGELGLEIPRVRSVLSIVDDIRLEYDFRLQLAGGQ